MTQRRNPSARSAKLWPAYRRLPPFVPVPVRARRDGWDAQRQGRFIGWLAQTGSVSEAAALLAARTDKTHLLIEKHRLRGPDGRNATVSIARIPE